jgi:hypothetical protein
MWQGIPIESLFELLPLLRQILDKGRRIMFDGVLLGFSLFIIPILIGLVFFFLGKRFLSTFFD